MKRRESMVFSNRMLMVITPIGVIIGLHEAWRLAGGLVVLVAAQIGLLTLAGIALVRKIREERQ